MSNTTKLLYILPDTAYIAELLATKKEHNFAIQSFRQINGSFMDENTFLAENVEKLLKKIDPTEYRLILPDFLFTNTIVDVAETTEASVKKYLKEQLLPNLGLTKQTHEIETFILTQHKNKTKVQLSALEKSLLEPITKTLSQQDLTISSISPLTWTIKSIVSLEPSLTIVQLGSMVYLGQHYIGVDQAISFGIEETEHVVEAVKTLKGAEPNIQTLYLLTNQLVENKIKESLSDTLPIQQLSTYSEEDAGIPSHVKHIIEAGARTLDITDFPVPQFILEKTTELTSKVTPALSQKPEVPEESAASSSKIDNMPLPPPSLPLSALPQPELSTAVPTPVAESPEPQPAAASLTQKNLENAVVIKKIDIVELDAADQVTLEKVVEKNEEIIDKELSEEHKPDQQNLPTLQLEDSKVVSSTFVFQESQLSVSVPHDIPVSTQSMIETSSVPQPPSPASFSYPSSPAPKPERTVIKNTNDAGSLLKIVGITLLALVVTVGVGVGIGVGLLSFSEKKANNLQHSPLTDASPTPPIATANPTPSPTPSAASSSATLSKATLKILVVNATTTAGKAGKFKSSLQAAGYKAIETGNAKGTYSEKGTFLLSSEPSGSLLSDLSKALGVTLLNQSDKTVEDAKAVYDAVIVIAE